MRKYSVLAPATMIAIAFCFASWQIQQLTVKFIGQRRSKPFLLCRRYAVAFWLDCFILLNLNHLPALPLAEAAKSIAAVLFCFLMGLFRHISIKAILVFFYQLTVGRFLFLKFLVARQRNILFHQDILYFSNIHIPDTYAICCCHCCRHTGGLSRPYTLGN